MAINETDSNLLMSPSGGSLLGEGGKGTLIMIRVIRIGAFVSYLLQCALGRFIKIAVIKEVFRKKSFCSDNVACAI